MSRYYLSENLTTQTTDYGVINGASGGRALPGGPRSVAADKMPGGARPSAIEELDAKIADFLAGRYGNLTTEEIAEFRDAQDDPDGTKWEKEHAGEVFGMDALDLNGFLFVEFPTEMPLEKCMEILSLCQLCSLSLLLSAVVADLPVHCLPSVSTAHSFLISPFYFPAATYF